MIVDEGAGIRGALLDEGAVPDGADVERVALVTGLLEVVVHCKIIKCKASKRGSTAPPKQEAHRGYQRR